MRKQFVQCETLEEAETECPWACEIFEVDGGFMCFESYSDSATWENQG